MTRTHQTQTFQLNQVTKEVTVTSGADGVYVLLEDVRDAFHLADEFTLDGEPVPFLEDEHHERLFPRRIAIHPGRVLTVVPLPDKDIQSLIVDPARLAMIEESYVFRSSLSPLSSPSSGLSRSSSSCQLSDATLEEKIHTMLESHHHKLQETQDHHTDTLMEQLVDLQSQVGRLQQDLHEANAKIAEQMHEMAEMQTKSLELHQQSIDMQQIALDKLMRLQTKITAVLTQTFELHEYPAPRLFIVLPEVGYEGLNPSSVLSSFALTKFRLYFLCECGPHTTPVGSRQLNHIHIARHEGYEITRPTEFFGKYGSYVLKLLMMLKNGISLASLAVPMLSLVNIVDLPESLVKGLGDKVNTSIQLLSVYQDVIDRQAPGLGADKVDVTANREALSDQSIMVPTKDSDANDSFVPMEGADFRMLSSFLKKKDQDRALGNLFRTVNEEGHVKWICLDHYRATYHNKQDRQFEGEVALNQGTYDHQLGKVSVILSSSYAAETFMVAMTRAHAFNELDVHLRNYSYQDLRHLGIALLSTNVSKLTLRAHQYKDFMAVGKRRIHAILKMMNSGKIRCFHFKQIKDLFPSKTVIPKEMPSILSLELTTMSVKEGHETLGEILRSCKNLSELRLTEVPLKSQRLTSVLKGVAACTKLQVLSLRACDIPSQSGGALASTLKTFKQLKELDLGFSLLEDSDICEIIEAVGGRLEKLWLPYTGFGDESAIALERVVVSSHLKCLDISDSVNELGVEGMESIIRLTSRLQCTELVMPRTTDLSDESCSRMVRGLNLRQLERLEIEGSNCGDLTAAALAEVLADPNHSHVVLTTLRIDLPNITLDGAHMLGRALGDCRLLKLSLRHSLLFQPVVVDRRLLEDLFRSAGSRLTVLDLRKSNMNDEVALVMCECFTETSAICRLEYLDVSRNQMTAAGASRVLDCFQSNQSLRVLRIESVSFTDSGCMGHAMKRFLEVNSSVQRLSISHVNLRDLSLGLAARCHVLKSIEVQYVDGEVDDIFSWGEFLHSSSNTLLRLVIKHARVCEDERSLEYLCQCLKQNKTILDLEWEFDQGWKVDSFVLQRYIERNQELWRKSAGSRADDLVLAGMDPWTIRAVSQSHD
ncbi:MAG: hypothetical protein BYD32DRAFT_419464 [Podila humilis]|nr:MAG: hypothetical protein BYD32DRAFT_419464 [Podila humilis]